MKNVLFTARFLDYPVIKDSNPDFQSVVDKYKILDIPPVPVSEIILYESIMRKTGVSYKIVKQFSLTA